MKMINIKYFLGVIFIVISIYNSILYLDYKSSMEISSKITYTFIKKIINSGGRGDYYSMLISYKEREHFVSLTSKEFELIDKQVFPILYESKFYGKIFSRWTERKTLRIAIVFSILSAIAILPWRFFLNRLINT